MEIHHDATGTWTTVRLKSLQRLAGALCLLLCAATAYSNEASTLRLQELDAYWAGVSAAVSAGDFDAYKASCHEQAVFVSGMDRTSYPLTQAFVRWEPGFRATREGKMQASVAFRFKQRYGDASTAHESGIFFYSSTNEKGELSKGYMHFEALLIKEDGWKLMMEYQQKIASEAEWQALQEGS